MLHSSLATALPAARSGSIEWPVSRHRAIPTAGAFYSERKRLPAAAGPVANDTVTHALAVQNAR